MTRTLTGDGELVEPKGEGVADDPVHALRHTAATLRLANGDHAKVLSEMLGHASITITIDLYQHAFPSIQREAADRGGNRTRATLA